MKLPAASSASFILLLAMAMPAVAQTSEACPWSAAELKSALGIDVSEGKATESPFAGGKMMSCEYRGKGKAGVALSQIRAANPSDAANIAKGLQGTAIPGDPDKAIWVAVVGDTSRISLSYVRASTHTEFSVTGVNSRNEAEAKPLRERMLKVKRVP